MSDESFRHCHVERDAGGLDWLILDVRGAPTNPISLELIDELHAVLDSLEERGDRTGLVLASNKTAGFAVGMDAATLRRLDDRPAARHLIERGQALTRRIAEWPVPTVTILHGVCQGGGMELALATRYRVAEAATTRLGFPEINLGLHPYMGGSARLSAIAGETPALSILLTGRMLGIEEAQKRGLVDRVGTTEGVETEAQSLLAERPGRQRPRLWSRVISSAPVRWTMELVRRSDYREFVDPESHPGKTALYGLWWRHASQSEVRWIAAERDSLLELVQKRATRNMIRVFLLQERLSAEARSQGTAAPRHIHIVGCGQLGSQLGVVLAAKGMAVSFQDHVDANEKAAVERARAALHRSTAVVDDTLERRLVATEGGADTATIADTDLVIEAVDEDLATKQAVLAAIAGQVGADVPLASTTSLFSISQLAEALDNPGRVLGLHFQIAITSRTLASIVEVVQGRDTTARALATGQALTTAMDHLPLVVGDCPGFLVRRLLLPYILAGAERYARPQREVIDGAARYVGMRVGPLELADWMGLDRCAQIATAMAGPDGPPLPEPLREKVDRGFYGCSTGHGFHDWRGYKRVTSTIPPRHERLDVLGPQLIKPLVEEAEHCRAQKMVSDDEAIELGAVVGAGFPAHTGGPLRYAEEVLGSETGGVPPRTPSWRDRLDAWTGGLTR